MNKLNTSHQLMEELSKAALESRKISPHRRQVVYASAEILPGRIIRNNLMNLPRDHEFRRWMEERGITGEDLAAAEEDSAMGNGGLGRLAACILESASTQGIPFTVCSLRYRAGLFRQTVRDGRQVAEPDRWLSGDGTHPMELPCPGEAQTVRFRHDDGSQVMVEMVPCLYPQYGYGGRHVNFISAWKVAGVRSDRETDLSRYRRIDDRLYARDADDEGKKLRICQFYALSAATVGQVLKHCADNGINVHRIPELFCLHINDTHCSFMIPELLRRLLDEYHLSWDDAWDIVSRTFVYTNHTILKEALETWPVSMIGSLLPRVCELIFQIDRCFTGYIRYRCPDIRQDYLDEMRIIRNGRIHMAHMDIYAACRVNGVAELHTRILCTRELKHFYSLMPEKFCNVTNGITQRLFLAEANPALADLITRCLGSNKWITDMRLISGLMPCTTSPEVQQQFMRIRSDCKKQLSRHLADRQGVQIPEDFLYDIQVKRIHLYKRQLMNCLRILDLYFRLEADPGLEMAPVAFFFGGKAAEDYKQAQLVIELIHAVARLVNSHPIISRRMRVCFVEDYNVSKAMALFPATDLSEQISTASREASGTGCFKAQCNGGIILGTMDGANVEICEAVGQDAMFVFGLSARQVMDYEDPNSPSRYDPQSLYRHDPRIRRVVDALTDGTVVRLNPPPGEPGRFDRLRDELLHGENGNAPDGFFVLGDLMRYIEASDRANLLYRTAPARWAELSLKNIACSGGFSSDRMVAEYAEKVWKLK